MASGRSITAVGCWGLWGLDVGVIGARWGKTAFDRLKLGFWSGLRGRWTLETSFPDGAQMRIVLNRRRSWCEGTIREAQGKKDPISSWDC